ncbi:MAG TPA: ABC transporter permease [Candidatus Binatia bacterium]|jgi:putative ABC transport system permease protein|nr:ABC transporter permease [Candidatus Binatia bacterium]
MTYGRLILRNLTRHPLRTLLTTLSIGLSIFLVCAVLTLPAALDAVFERAASNQRISVHHKAGLTYWLPGSFVRKVHAIPGVSGINQFSWFGGIYDEPKNQFPNFAVDPETVGQVWPDYNIAPDALERFRRIRNGALVGAELMAQFGWRVGQLITLRGTVFPVDLTFEIVGVMPSGGGIRMLWFNRTYLEEAMEPKGGMKNVGMIWMRAERPELVDGIIKQVDALFRNSEAEVAAETEKAFFATFLDSLRGLMRVILIVGFLVVGAVVLIAANTSAMGVRERIPEIAILKSIGFRRGPILAALLAESMLQGFAGGLLGAGGAYAILEALRLAGKTGNTAFLGPLGGFRMSPIVAAEGLAIAVVVGIVAGLVPAWNGARINVVDAMRRLF